MSSSAVKPVSARWSRRSIAARNVPSRVNVPTWASQITASSHGRPAQPASRQTYASGSTSSDGPFTSPAWARAAGSGTTLPSPVRKTYSEPARASGDAASNQPSPTGSIRLSRPSTRSAIAASPGAQILNRAPPSGRRRGPQVQSVIERPRAPTVRAPARRPDRQRTAAPRPGEPRRSPCRASPAIRPRSRRTA